MQTAPRRRPRMRVIGVLLVVAIGLFAIVVTGDRDDLAPWHEHAPRSEFRAADATDGFDLDDYRALEDAVFSELDAMLRAEVTSGVGLATSRYLPDGRNDPSTFPVNWNRTFVVERARPAGAVLLLHGLTDSPYSLRSLGERFADAGFAVVGFRLPGHGTVPEALDRVRRRDWQAAVRIAARATAAMAPDGAPFVIVGYSNGAALGLDYALAAVDEPGLPPPDRLILVSPAVGITAFAAVAGLPRALRFVPLADGLRWNSVEPEIDPFKYGSFPANAAYQTHKLTVANRRRIARLAADGRAASLPPILAFVSLADSTVKMESIAADLMMPLADPRHEMVVFDVNRQADIVALFGHDPVSRLAWLAEQAPAPWAFTAITNEGPRSRAVVEKRWPGGVEEPLTRALGMEWPETVYSLSHVALPFAPDDPLYGAIDDPERTWGLPLGSLEPRGERGLLRLSIESVMRLRYNPFYGYLERRALEFAGARGEGAAAAAGSPPVDP